MKKLITILAVAAVSISFANMAQAKDKGAKGGASTMTPEEKFKKLDADGDGKISMDEWKASPMAKKDPTKAEEMFKAKDKDSDGKLTMEEFSAGGHKAK